ncbi:MAG: hypothetical protein RL885_09910 [Planctomycetota bacterium]
MIQRLLCAGAIALFLSAPAQAQDPDFFWCETGPDRVVRLANVDGESNGFYGNDAQGIEAVADFVRGYATANSAQAIAVDTSGATPIFYYYERSNLDTGGNPNGEGIYRGVDTNRTGRLDYVEVAPFWPANGTAMSNTPEMVIDGNKLVIATDGYSSGINGIYALEDINGNGFIDLGTAEELLLTGTGSSLTTVDGLTLSVDDFERIAIQSPGVYLAWETDDFRIYRMTDTNGSGAFGDANGEVSVYLDLNSGTGGVLPGGTTDLDSIVVDQASGFVYVSDWAANFHQTYRINDNGDNVIDLNTEIALWADFEALTSNANPFIGDVTLFNGDIWALMNFGSALTLDIFRCNDGGDGTVDPGSDFVQAYSGPSAFISSTLAAVPDGTFTELRDPKDLTMGSVLISVNPAVPGSPTPSPGEVATPNTYPTLVSGNTFQFEFNSDDQVANDLMNLGGFPLGFVLFATGTAPSFTLPASGLRPVGIRFDSFTNLSATALAPLLQASAANPVTPTGTYSLNLPGLRIYYVGITRDASFNWGNISQVSQFILN